MAGRTGVKLGMRMVAGRNGDGDSRAFFDAEKVSGHACGLWPGGVCLLRWRERGGGGDRSGGAGIGDWVEGLDDAIEVGLGATVRGLLAIGGDDFAERIATRIEKIQTNVRGVSGISDLETTSDGGMEGVDAGFDFGAFGYGLEEQKKEAPRGNSGRVEKLDLIAGCVKQDRFFQVWTVFDICGEKRAHRRTADSFVFGDVLQKASRASWRPDHKNLAQCER
jgi:hypothetical protein